VSGYKPEDLLEPLRRGRDIVYHQHWLRLH
jgi:hypothetical protein